MSALKDISLSANLKKSLPPFGLPFSAVPGGLPKGCIVEISGPGATAWAARFLEENPWMHAAWIERNIKDLPDTVLHRDLNRKRILFVDGQEDSSWAASMILQSGEFPVVVYHAPYGEEKELRRFRKNVRDTNTNIILLRDTPCFAWPIAVQFRASEEKIELLRRR